MRHGGAWLGRGCARPGTSTSRQQRRKPTQSELEMTVVQPRLAVMSHLGSGLAYAIRPAPPGCQ